MRIKGYRIALLLLLCCAGCGRKVQDNAGGAQYILEQQVTDGTEQADAAALQEHRDTVASQPEEPVQEASQAGAANGEDPALEETRTELPQNAVTDMQVTEWLEQLTLEEKVAQMFIVLPESFMGVSEVTAAGDTTRSMIDQFPVGGFIYMEPNLISAGQIREMLSGVQDISMERIGLPAFCCVDEEGGTVARIGGRGIVDAPYVGNMSEIGASGNCDQAYQAGAVMGGYLSELGFNVDFAPVADVLSNPANTVVRDRSFGSDPELVSEMVLSELEGLEATKVYGTLKHFPGHGATEGDTHAGYAYTARTLEEMKQCELLPFQRGIDAGVSFIMVGHISVPGITGDDTPSSLSRTMITDVLRNQMGYDGLVITDALNMGAVSQIYSSAEAAVRTVQAGADLILMPADFQSAYYGVLEAVASGVVSEERINESLERILEVKLEMIADGTLR